MNEYRVSVWDNEKILDMDGGDGCTTMQMCLMPLNCTLKMVKVNFVTFILSQYFYFKDYLFYFRESMCAGRLRTVFGFRRL